MKRWHVLAYDVSDQRRLQRVHRCVSRRALAVQRSVFLFLGSNRELKIFMAEIETLMDPAHDDVRVYPSAHPSEMWMSSMIEARQPATLGDDEPLFLSGPDERTTGALRKLWRRLGGGR